MRVFLSSTYVDLVEHRRAVREALQRLDQQVVWMESLGARPQEPTRACLREVEQSDLFVGIYAHRYGFVPAQSDLSITELEYDRALGLERPIFAFIVDEEFDWKPNFIERGVGQEKLEAFKERVLAQWTIDRFTTPMDLAFRATTSVSNYLLREELPKQARRLPLPTGGNQISHENIALLHTSFRYPKADQRFRDGRQYYGIEVIIMAQDAVTERIRSVTYHLEGPYPEPNRTQVVTDRASRFKLKELANGTSIITATIDIEGRDELLTLNRFIDLRSDGPRL